MKIRFKADASAALEKTRRKLADVEANIAALQTSRTEKLATTEDIAEVQSIDRAILAERTAAEIYRTKSGSFRKKSAGSITPIVSDNAGSPSPLLKRTWTPGTRRRRR